MDDPSQSTDPAPGRDLVGSLDKGLGVMETLADHPEGMTLTQMAASTGLTRAGARRLLLTLVAAGYAVQDGRMFRLSPKLLTIARRWLGGASLWTFAEPFMREVSGRLNESCSAAVLADQDVVYVARVGSTRILSVALNVGTRLPAWCTSMGRVLAAGLPDRELETFLPLNKSPWRRAAFRVLKAPDVPSVLLELGYLSNRDDEELLTSVEWRRKGADRIARSIEAFMAGPAVSQHSSQ